MIVIVDYGMGNLRSVQKAFQKVGQEALITSEPDRVLQASKVVLPGVGAFGNCMTNLKERHLIDPIYKFIKTDRPFLGICLGLQLLFTKSEEGEVNPVGSKSPKATAPPLAGTSNGVKGLNIIKGRVKRFDFSNKGLKVPHMGWNQVKCKIQNVKCKILRGIPDGSYFYFVHSYYVEPDDESIITATTEYGLEFVSMIHKGNIYGTQFHPEKSQELGLRMLKNFGEL